jgi:hypothetical protein
MVRLVDYPTPEPKPLNGKQFSQGALFNIKPSAEHRWPRGYSPERRDAVAAAIDDTTVRVRHHENQHGTRKMEPGTDTFLHSGTFFTPGEVEHRGTWSKTGDDLQAEQAGQAKRALTDIVARSTVPQGHLRNLPTIHIENIAGAAGDYSMPDQNTMRFESGLYVPDTESAIQGRIRIDPNGKPHQIAHTVLHELGHAVDYRDSPSAFKTRLNDQHATWGGSTASPKLEGFAEGYAHGHYVPSRQEAGTPLHVSYEQFASNPEFRERFEKASGGMNVRDILHQRDQRTSAELDSWAAERRRSWGGDVQQPHLFSRDASRELADDEVDYGQHGYVDHSERDPEWQEAKNIGTIRVGDGPPPSEQRRLRR